MEEEIENTNETLDEPEITIPGGPTHRGKNASEQRTMKTNLAAEVIEMVWRRYEANMAAGKMRQRPGRSEYQGELQKAGLLEKSAKAAREFYFNYTPRSEIGQMILKIERRHTKRNK
jgi:hypothetical protein